jgi:hypothetical protein
MARTLTGNNARREQLIQSRILDRLVIRYRVRIRNEIRRAMNAAAKSMSDPESPGVVSSKVWAEHRRRIDVIMRKLWTDSGHTMSEHINPNEKAANRRHVKQEGEPRVLIIDPTEQADRIMQQWITERGGALIVNISETTRKNVRKVIDDGIAEGLSERDIAANIRAISSSVADSRSQTIARTETHGAANFAAEATAQATGLDFVREWAASRGPRTRDTHRKADGQKVGMGEYFNVGRAKLRYPGDSSAGHAEETINCRCAVLYVLR